MKPTTLIGIVIALIIVVGGGYYFMITNQSAVPAPVDVTVTTDIPGAVATAPISQIGERCGGNMQNAPVCAQGAHCAKASGSNLPMGDVGGICVADNTAQYVDGNLLLGTDATTTLGTYLIGYNGMTLYRFAKDSAGTSTCANECAAKWPPYVVASTDALENLQSGIKGVVSSIARTDGSMQVTYNGSPLYFFAADTKSGDTSGNKVNNAWFVLKP